ncbi:hypothetical protein A7985_24280 [Pseudoalteromonas luteoviolacea]|uniref:Uncharacterized protein n=1 Tax=Pseudoalteromonas luteoviolacea TaxID=43657 RepID=A0A1C0TIZ9_9GAMM|nr:hypothetical protein [Pseudoalteromonas luteoviolacea]OCQ18237.1 hypothetical protein A7985_24280 [Pseudoalteromonas luteoviolacea]
MKFQYFIRLLLLSTLYIQYVKANTFEQAFVPIYAGGSFVYTPMELLPNHPDYFSIKSQGDNHLLAWYFETDVQYYQIEALVNGQWQTLSQDVTSSFYHVPLSTGATSYRIRGCHNHGCSEWKESNRTVSKETDINAFYADNIVIDKFHSVTLNWVVQGASAVMITSNLGGEYRNLNPESGSLRVEIYKETTFTLSIADFKGQNQYTEVTVGIPPDSVVSKGVKTEYIQPLYDINQDINHKTILAFDDAIYFATHDRKLVHYRYEPNAQTESKWQLIWEKSLPGVINNPPARYINQLFYSVSMFGGKSQVCSVSLAGSSQHTCTQVKPAQLYASPIVVDTTSLPQSHLSWLQKLGITPIESQAINGIYVFYANGEIALHSLDDLSAQPRRFAFPQSLQNEIIDTPKLFIGAPNTNSAGWLQFAVRDGNRLRGLQLPIAQSSNSLLERAMSLFSFGDAETSQSQNTQILNQAWSAEL